MTLQRFNNTERIKKEIKEAENLLPRSMANQPFKYVHYPQAWRYISEAGEFLPQLGALIAMPSVNGVLKNGDMSKLIFGSIAKGGTVIDDENPLLGEYQYYVGRAKCEGGGWRYSYFDDGTVRVGDKYKLDHDRVGWIKFLQFIKHSGIITPMDPIVFRARIDAMEERATRLALASSRPHLLKATEKKLVDMKAAWELELKTRAENKQPIKAAPKQRGKRGPVKSGTEDETNQ